MSEIPRFVALSRVPQLSQRVKELLSQEWDVTGVQLEPSTYCVESPEPRPQELPCVALLLIGRSVIAHGCLESAGTAMEQPWGKLSFIIVDSKFRSMGYGRQMVQQLCEVAKSVNMSGIIIQCKMDLVEFYKKIGFQFWRISSEVDEESSMAWMRLEF